MNHLLNYCRDHIDISDNSFQEISRITKHIYMSDYDRASEPKKLYDIGIKHVLYIGDQPKWDACINEYMKYGIYHTQIKNIDESNVSSIFLRCYDIIWDMISHKEKILIHCLDGITISPIIVLYFVLKRYYRLGSDKKSKLFRSFKFVHSKRPCINPSKTLFRQIIDADNKLRNPKNVDFDLNKNEILKIPSRPSRNTILTLLG